jgi:hypothetical protein
MFGGDMMEAVASSKKDKTSLKVGPRIFAMFFSLILTSVCFMGGSQLSRAHNPSMDDPDPCPEWQESYELFDTYGAVVSYLEAKGYQRTWGPAAGFNPNDYTLPFKYMEHHYAWYRSQAIVYEREDLGKWTYRTQSPEPNPDITTYPNYPLLNTSELAWIVGYVTWWHLSYCTYNENEERFDPFLDGFSFQNKISEAEKMMMKGLIKSFVSLFVYGPGEKRNEILQEQVATWAVENFALGLCEGMSAAAAYYYYYPEALPEGRNSASEALRSEVINEIYSRHIESWLDPGTWGTVLLASKGLLSDQHQYDLIREHIDSEGPSVVLLYNVNEPPWYMHAVLAHDYLENADSTTFYIYDPNYNVEDYLQPRLLEIDSSYKTTYWRYSHVAYLGKDVPQSNPTQSLIAGMMDRIVRVILESPADIHVYDSANRHTGLDASGKIEAEIPGSYYVREDPFQDETIGIVDANDDYKLNVKGNANGFFDLTIEILEGDSYLRIRYENVQVTPTTTATIHLRRYMPDYGMYIDGTRRNPDVVSDVDVELPELPVADAGADIVVYEGDTVQLDASRSEAFDGQIISYEWTFDGHVLYGPNPTFICYDNTVVSVTLTITYLITYFEEDGDGGLVEKTYVGTSTDTLTVTVLNVNPTASIDASYMLVDFTLRVAGEKWHNVYWDLYETDWPCDGCEWQRPGTTLEHLEVERYPGDPDKQSKTAHDVYIDMEKLYYFVATYNPYEDDNPISGQLWGANPVWIDLTFEDGSKERIHHTFNVQQSLVRDSEHWVHVEPWYVDLSPWFVGHEVTFEASTYDPGTDDVTFHWEWGDGTVDESFLFTYRSGNVTDPYPSPYDRDQGTYPVNIVRAKFYHTYAYEGDFLVTLTVEDDDKGLNDDRLEIDAIHTQHIYPTR